MRLRPSNSSSSSATTPKKYDPERTCDSCFNRLVFEYQQWCITLARLRREQQRYEQRLAEERAGGSASVSRSNTLTGGVSPGGGSGSANGSMRRNTSSQQLFPGSGGDLSPANSGRQASASIQGTTQTMNEAMRALEERGERLQQVSERSEEMRVAASEFRSMTRQLLNQQQSRAGMR